MKERDYRLQNYIQCLYNVKALDTFNMHVEYLIADTIILHYSF